MKARTIEGKTIKEWSDINNIPTKEIYRRIKRGWDIKKAITDPLRSRSKRQEIVGNEYKDRFGNKLIVIAKQQNKLGTAYYKVRFVESGFETTATAQQICEDKYAHVFDRLHPTYANVGMIGYAKQSDEPKLFYVWSKMIDRCYNPKNAKYKNYGAAGVYVCDRWKRFDLFLQDVKLLPGFDLEKINIGQLTIDKDIINCNNRIYGPETCCFVSRSENSIDANKRRAKKNKM